MRSRVSIETRGGLPVFHARWTDNGKVAGFYRGVFLSIGPAIRMPWRCRLVPKRRETSFRSYRPVGFSLTVPHVLDFVLFFR